MIDRFACLKSIDIGPWRQYNILIDEEQLALQEASITRTGLKNGSSEIGFIFTPYMETLNADLETLCAEIEITDTTVALENEVFYTAKIEGANTTRIRTSELHNGAPVNPNNKKSELMVKNGFQAVKLLNLYGNTLNDKILIKVWNALVEGVCENKEARGPRFRTAPIYVGSYEPPECTTLEDLMQKYLDFYNGPAFTNYPFIKAILLHYAFETIHPFCDGNGRMGRLLINNYLISQGIDSAKAVSFSMLIDAKRKHYDVAFVDSENDHNDCTPFLIFMLETMKETYLKALSVQNKKNKDQEAAREM